MRAEEESELRSPALREALRAYAARIKHLFSYMGKLSGTGLEIRREFHSSIYLEEIQSDGDENNSYDPAKNRRAGVKRLSELPTPELELLSRWSADSPSSLLLLAPFGSGKSVVLETFAYSMADTLAHDAIYPEGGLPPLVPLPIRLRGWNWQNNESFERYLWRSQQTFEGVGDDGTLTFEQVQALRISGRLVILLDGFDELPADYDSDDGSSPRYAVHCAIRSILKPLRGNPCHVLVTSRPGTGIERDWLIGARKHSLKELDWDEMGTYVRRWFNLEDDDETSAPTVALHEAYSTISGLLSRPLFLAIWCEEFARNQTRLPENMDRFMECLVLKAFDPQRIKQWISRRTIHRRRFSNYPFDREEMLRLLPQLGALLHILSERGFTSKLPLVDFVDSARRSVPELDENRVAWLLFLVERAGLLIRVGDTRVSAIKVPVAEFLIGKYLSSLARGSDANVRQLVQVFRRWVWLPEFHDVLVFSLESLRTGRPAEIQLANDCCGWLLNVAEACPLHTVGKGHGSPSAFGQDDLVRPFAYLALRLGANQRRSIDAIVAAACRAVHHHEGAFIPIFDQVPGKCLKQVIAALLVATRGSDDLRFSLFLESLQDAIRRLPAPDGGKMVDLLIGELSATGDGEEPIGNWIWIVDGVSTAAKRIPRRDRMGCIRKWLGRIAGENGKDVQYLLSLAINAAVDRVDEGEIPAAKKAISDAASDRRYSHVKTVLEGAVTKLTGLKWNRRTATGAPREFVTNRYSVNSEALRRKAEEAVKDLRVGEGKDAIENARLWLDIAATSEIKGGAEDLVWVLVDALTDAQSVDSAISLLTRALANALRFEPNALTSQVIAVLFNAMNRSDDLEKRLTDAMVDLAPGLDSSQAVGVVRAFHARLLNMTKPGEEYRRPVIEGAIRRVARFLNSEGFAELCADLGKEGDFHAVVCLASDRPEFTAVVEGFDRGSATWRCGLRRRDDKTLLLGGGCELLAPKEIKRLLETEFAAPEEDSSKSQKIVPSANPLETRITAKGHWSMKEIRKFYSDRSEKFLNALGMRLRRWAEREGNCGSGDHQAKAITNRSGRKTRSGKATFHWRWPAFKVKEYAQELSDQYKE